MNEYAQWIAIAVLYGITLWVLLCLYEDRAQ